jgi:hypothetical protein
MGVAGMAQAETAVVKIKARVALRKDGLNFMVRLLLTCGLRSSAKIGKFVESQIQSGRAAVLLG